MSENAIRVTITYLPSVDYHAANPDRFEAPGYTVTLEDNCGAQTVKGLTWDEMHGFTLSIFPAPRRPLFSGRVRLNEDPGAAPDPDAFVKGGRNDH